MVTKSPEKLLFAISSLHGGGAERVISNLANYYDAAGFQVSIVCLNASKPAYFLSEGIKVISLLNTPRRTGLFFRIWYALLSFFRLRRFLKREKPECAISFMTSANIWIGLTCLSLKIPYLVSERITLIGFRENMQDYYRQAELFILSSRNEGYPNALLEAMSMGTACIATDCEYGPSDILESGKNGLLIRTGNIYQMASAIKMVLDDPILRAKIALNAKRINETNSLANTSAKWLELIRRVS